MSKIVFVTGTDTGVGKTVLTGLLARHLKRRGIRVKAVKPVCCGGREDLKFLQQMQGAKGSISSLCAAYFPLPVAPGAIEKAAQKSRAAVRFLAGWILQQARQADLLLVEGCGGLLVPLNGQETVLDLLKALKSPVVLVAPNRVGVINHTLLSINALESIGARSGMVVLMGQKRADRSVRSNRQMLEKWGKGWEVVEIPCLEKRELEGRRREESVALKKSLAQLIRGDIFMDVLSKEAVG